MAEGGWRPWVDLCTAVAGCGLGSGQCAHGPCSGPSDQMQASSPSLRVWPAPTPGKEGTSCPVSSWPRMRSGSRVPEAHQEVSTPHEYFDDGVSGAVAFSPRLVSWAWTTQPSQGPFCSLQPPPRRPDQGLAQVSRLWVSDVRSRCDMPGGPKSNKQAPLLPPRPQEGLCRSPKGTLRACGHSPSSPATCPALKECQVREWGARDLPPLGTGPPAVGGSPGQLRSTASSWDPRRRLSPQTHSVTFAPEEAPLRAGK